MLLRHPITCGGSPFLLWGAWGLSGPTDNCSSTHADVLMPAHLYDLPYTSVSSRGLSGWITHSSSELTQACRGGSDHRPHSYSSSPRTPLPVPMPRSCITLHVSWRQGAATTTLAPSELWSLPRWLQFHETPPHSTVHILTLPAVLVHPQLYTGKGREFEGAIRLRLLSKPTVPEVAQMGRELGPLLPCLQVGGAPFSVDLF